jgi:osmotically-inducible protein OsmY
MSWHSGVIVPRRRLVCRVVEQEIVVAQLTDELISRHGVSCIRKHVPIVINGLKVIVQGGHVTLQGRVSLAFLSTRAERLVRELPGVTGLTNQIVVTPASVANTESSDSAHLHTRSATASTLLRSTTATLASGRL